jgi:DNA invertase Pin-like site-specific DNA recombinase
MKKGALYIRVSTDEQIEYSPSAQLRALKDYALKHDIIVNDENIYIDEGFSGRHAERRPAFQQMIKTAKTDPSAFNVILVHKFDRFSRSREDSVVYKSLLKKECNIKVISITEQLEDDKFSIILESMLEAMAEYYSLNLADEVKKGMTEKAKRGEYQCRPPFGYVMENKTLKILAEEAIIISFIFEKYVYDNLSCYSIAKQLNSMGFRTRKGNSFESRTIEYILNNPVYIGKSRWNPSGKTNMNYDNPKIILSDSNHTSIITDELFYKAQTKMSTSKKNFRHKKRPSSGYSHWLSGLVRCGSCGSKLVYMNSKYPCFQCGGYNNGKCSISHSISVNKLEKAIINRIKYDIQNAYPLNYKLIDNNDTSEINMISSQLDKIPIKLQKVKEAFYSNIDNLDEYKINKEKIMFEEKQLKKMLYELTSKNKNKLYENKLKNNIKYAYELVVCNSISISKKHSVLTSFIKEVVYNKNENTLVIEYYIHAG